MRAEGLLDRLCSLLANGRLGEAFGFLDDVRWCDVRAHDPVHGHPLHQSCRCSELSLEWWLRVDLCILIVRLC